MIAVDVHRVALVAFTSDRGGHRHAVAFRGECSCGATSRRLPSAGMVSGWEATHREEAGEL